MTVHYNDNKDEGIMNPSFDFVSKTNLRKDLQSKLLESKQIPDIKQKIKDASIYSGIHEGIFKNKSSLRYAQMNQSVNFIEKSKVSEYLFALFVDNSKDIKAICEFVLYAMVKKLNCAPDEAMFYALPLD